MMSGKLGNTAVCELWLFLTVCGINWFSPVHCIAFSSQIKTHENLSPFNNPPFLQQSRLCFLP